MTPTPTETTYRAEIDRLLSLESGKGVDIAFRMIGIPIGSVLFYLYSGSPLSFAWSGGYVATYVAYRLYLRSFGRQVSYSRMVSAHLAIIVLTLSFLWFPTLMLVSPDRNLSLAGAGLVMSQLMHLVHRGDTNRFLIFGVTLAVFGMMMGALISILPQITDPIAIVGIFLSWVSLGYYLGTSLLAARARILAESEAKAHSFQAQKLAALGQLAGGVAHDFNNILTAISGNLELHKELTDPKEKQEVVDAAHEASNRAAKIVSQILIYARKSRVELEMIPANAPLCQIEGLTAHLIPPRIQLSLVPTKSDVFVRIDQDQFVTALMNLVLNAVDAIEGTGQIKLTVKIEKLPRNTRVVGGQVLPSGVYVVYRVKDTGTGIPDDVRKSVADPFFTTKPVGKGTGLGLSMAVSIAESVGGGLWIKSSDAGTTVAICVPC